MVTIFDPLVKQSEGEKKSDSTHTKVESFIPADHG